MLEFGEGGERGGDEVGRLGGGERGGRLVIRDSGGGEERGLKG